MQREMSRFRKLKFEHQRINVGVLNRAMQREMSHFRKLKFEHQREICLTLTKFGAQGWAVIGRHGVMPSE